MMPYVETVNTPFGTGLGALLNTAPAGAGLVLGAWAVLRFTKGINASTRHLFWWVVLALCLALPALRVFPVAEFFQREEPSRALAVESARPVTTVVAAAE